MTNQATAYGVHIEQAEATGAAWRVKSVEHLSPEANAMRHHVYVDAIDEAGRRVQGLWLGFSWDGQRQDEQPAFPALDKPANEPAGNVPMFWGAKLTVWIQDSLPSDRVSGLHTAHPDEPGEGNRTGHHSFAVVFQRGVGVAGAIDVVERLAQQYGLPVEIVRAILRDGCA
jgi:hypothetical protein